MATVADFIIANVFFNRNFYLMTIGIDFIFKNSRLCKASCAKIVEP